MKMGGDWCLNSHLNLLNLKLLGLTKRLWSKLKLVIHKIQINSFYKILIIFQKLKYILLTGSRRNWGSLAYPNPRQSCKKETRLESYIMENMTILGENGPCFALILILYFINYKLRRACTFINKIHCALVYLL